MPTTVEHNAALNVTDGRSKYGRGKRTYQAVCSCGWESRWAPVVKRSAQEDLNAHLASVQS